MNLGLRCGYRTGAPGVPQFVGAASSTSGTVAIPSVAVASDVAIYVASGGNVGVTVPEGWNIAYNAYIYGEPGDKMSVFWRRLTSADLGTSPSTGLAVSVIGVYRGTADPEVRLTSDKAQSTTALKLSPMLATLTDSTLIVRCVGTIKSNNNSLGAPVFPLSTARATVAATNWTAGIADAASAAVIRDGLIPAETVTSTESGWLHGVQLALRGV